MNHSVSWRHRTAKMDALIASYGDKLSDSDSERDNPTTTTADTASMRAKSSNSQSEPTHLPLSPPSLSPLNLPDSICSLDSLPSASRVRSFPHVEGNYALHVYIPVFIPSARKDELAHFLKKVSSIVPGLHVVDVDVPINSLYKDNTKLEQVALGREFHISLGRTVPIRVHQIGSMVAMLRQKLQSQRRYWIDFTKWEVFVNDNFTRTFLSIEVLKGGLLEITKQIQAVNEVYKLHNLPEFYKDPRPHISLAWAVGDISNSLKRVVEDEMKRVIAEGSLRNNIFSSKFCGIQCKIGKNIYKICKFLDE